MSGVLVTGTQKSDVKGPKWMKETLLDPNTYYITNVNPRCQRTLLRFPSRTFGPVRIVQQSNLYGYKNGAVQNHRLAVLGENDELLAELHYSPRRFARKNELRIHRIRSIRNNLGLASSLLSVLCHLEPDVPKTLNANASSLPKFERLGFVRSFSSPGEMHLGKGELAPQGWAGKKHLLFFGKRKIFIK